MVHSKVLFNFCFWYRNEVFDGPNAEYVEEAEDTLESVLNMNVDEVAEKWYSIIQYSNNINP